MRLLRSKVKTVLKKLAMNPEVCGFPRVWHGGIAEKRCASARLLRLKYFRARDTFSIFGASS